MVRYALRSLGVALLFVMASAPQTPTKTLSPVPQQVSIRLRNQTFDPLQLGLPLARGQHTAPVGSRRDSDAPDTYILQFTGAVLEAWVAETQRYGVRLHGYIPEHAYIAQVSPSALDSVRSLPYVRWIGPYLPSYRMEPELLSRSASLPTGLADIVVQALPDTDMPELGRAISALGGNVTEVSSNRIAHYLGVSVPNANLEALASLSGVIWLQPAVPSKLLNDSGAAIVGATGAQQQLGLFGAGQIVAVADSGLDTGNSSTLNSDVRNRVTRTYCLGRASPCDWSDPNGHGTHVVGSVLGNGLSSGSTPASHAYSGTFAGAAPEASLVFQSLGDAVGGLRGIPTDRGALMRTAYGDGARIHSNSWGGPTGSNADGTVFSWGGYSISSQQVDQAAWELKDMLILFAAGNQGADANKDGVVDADALSQPGTAKNVLTVGASENERPGVTSSWGQSYGFAAPILDSRRADNRNGMAAFSSRGPTDDGRIKPDVVAPGTRIVSLRSRKTAFESTVENNSGQFAQRSLNGGTTSWQISADAHSAPNSWRQNVTGNGAPRAMTALFTPELNLAPFGEAVMIRLWNKHRLTGDNRRAFVFSDGATAIWLVSARSGTLSAHEADEMGVPISALVEQGLNITKISVGFALISDSGTYNSEWIIDDIQIGPYLDTMAGAGLAPAGSTVDSAYGLNDGTSMATPLTAGGMALLREWFGRNGVQNPSAALLKAATMNAAIDMAPGQYGTGTFREIPAQRPNAVQGWGRVDVMAVMSPTQPNKTFFVDETTGLRTRDSMLISFTLGSAGANLLSTANFAEPASIERMPAISAGLNRQASMRARNRQPTGLASMAPQLQPGFAEATSMVEQLIVNGGFEQSVAWETSTNGPFAYSSAQAHSGARSARSTPGEDGYMWQLVTIPSDAITATLDFFWSNLNPDPGYDELQVSIYDATLQNQLGAGGILSASNTAWQLEHSPFVTDFLVSLRGQTVAIVIDVFQDSSAPDASFYIDDVTLSVGRGGAPVSPTPTASPTMTGQPPTATPTHTPTPTSSGSTSTSTPTPTPTRTPTPPPATATATPVSARGLAAITVAWTDFPGEPAAAKALVNDLDLELIGPDGTRYYGNQGIYATGNPCLREGRFDACNNVESVFIDDPKPGTYRLIIRSAQTAKGQTQPFALAVTGPSALLASRSIVSGQSHRVHLPMMRR